MLLHPTWVRHTRLHHTRLRHTRLRHAMLRHARLRHTRLRHTRLRHALLLLEHLLLKEGRVDTTHLARLLMNLAHGLHDLRLHLGLRAWDHLTGHHLLSHSHRLLLRHHVVVCARGGRRHGGNGLTVRLRWHATGGIRCGGGGGVTAGVTT